MKVVLLGHSGFIGRRVAMCLAQRVTEGEVVGCSYPEFDLTRAEDVDRISACLTPDTAVVMCAGVKRQLGDSLATFRQNLQMVENMCAVLQQKRVARFIYFSSAAVYGEDVHNTGITEDTAVEARTFYGIAKYASERLLWKALSLHSEGVLAVLRPPLAYGPGDESRGYGPSGFWDKLKRDEEIVLWGDGSELREFLFVQDLACIVVELVFSRFSGVLNPVSGTSHSFRAVLDRLSAIAGKTPRMVSRPRTKSKVDNVFLNMRMREVLPDFRFTSLDQGLDALIREEAET